MSKANKAAIDTWQSQVAGGTDAISADGTTKGSEGERGKMMKQPLAIKLEGLGWIVGNQEWMWAEDRLEDRFGLWHGNFDSLAEWVEELKP